MYQEIDSKSVTTVERKSVRRWCQLHHPRHRRLLAHIHQAGPSSFDLDVRRGTRRHQAAAAARTRSSTGRSHITRGRRPRRAAGLHKPAGVLFTERAAIDVEVIVIEYTATFLPSHINIPLPAPLPARKKKKKLTKQVKQFG
jgi:hypothetical protein